MLVLVMVVGLFPVTAFAAETNYSSFTQNTNQSDGVVLRKASTLHLDENNNPDGTIDIRLAAYTTGAVQNTETITPTDIVLVLDLSGSMNETYTSNRVTSYSEVTGSLQSSGFGWWNFGNDSTYYGFSDQDGKYYRKSGDAYITLKYVGEDSNGFSYYSYESGTGTTYVYPVLSGNGYTRESNYEVVQFYSRTTVTQSETKITALKRAVNSFLEKTAELNGGIATDARHRVAIVKFADDSYKTATGSTSNIANTAQSVVGNDRNGNGYNYTQIVTDRFETVTEENLSSLKSKVNALTPGGATAVDYGLALAQYAFDCRADQAGRNEVVIVFSDGDPNHFDGFDNSVAGAAVNYALALKNASTKVYTISVDSDADPAFDPATGATGDSNDSNRFNQYLSSNYPSASARNGVPTPGNGDYTAGYYLVPSSGLGLDGVFEHIAETIDRPTVSLGDSAAVIDTLTPYFNTNTNKITLQVAKANAEGGFETPTDAPLGVTATLDSTNRQITVKGFDFDKNFVSKEPRDGNFYGQALIITINATPDYAYIDASSAMSAAVETNQGSAKIVTGSTVVAETASPDFVFNTVTYQVNGSPVKTYYRVPGATVEQDPKPSKTGYTYSDWSQPTPGSNTQVTVSGGSFTMPLGDVVFETTETVNTHSVTYEYEGTAPSDAPTLPEPKNVAYGTTVTVAQTPTLDGYDFHGWISEQVTASAGSFTMPDQDVVIKGHFVARDDTPYQVMHILQMPDGNWPEETNVDNKYVYSATYAGKTGDTVTAAQRTFEGYTYGSTEKASVTSATIDANGTTVLKLYYTVNSHTVKYIYKNLPTDASALSPKYEDDNSTYVVDKDSNGTGDTYTVNYGATFTVDVAVTPPENWSFPGWLSNDVPRDPTASDANLSSFTMPDHDVVIFGYFVQTGGLHYVVEHYLELPDTGSETKVDYPATATYSTANRPEAQQLTGIDGEVVTAGPINFTGYVLDDSAPNVKSGTLSSASHSDAGTPLVLKLYYKRATYDVTYHYADQNQPTSAPKLPDTTQYKYGATVHVEPDLALTGYTFAGWTSYGGAVTAEMTSFTMPARNVDLYGRFVANTDTPYRVMHFLQNEDGSYPDTTEHIFNYAGKTGESVTPLVRHFDGYTHNPDAAGSVLKGVIADDGSTVFKLYYQRNTYNVTYRFTGLVPDSSLTAPSSQSARYGATVTVAGDPTVTGYTFVGWTSDDVTPTVGVDDSTFTMPSNDVVLVGHFVPLETTYTVKHLLQNVDGDGYTLATEKDLNGKEGTQTFTAEVGTSVAATANSYAGFTIRTDNTWEGRVQPNNGLVLELKYDRNTYNVHYVYYGVQPDGITLPNDESGVPFGKVVDIEDDLSVGDANEFHGWRSNQVRTFDAAGNEETSFTMPAQDVYLYCYVASDYTVEYYLDGVKDNSKTETVEDIAVGTAVTADPKEITGYTFDEQNPSNVPTGTIAMGGTTVLKLYYTKNETPYIPPIIPPAVTDGTAVLIKVDADDDDTFLTGAKFELYRVVNGNDELVGTYATNQYGKITVEDLNAGNYFWKEISAPEGYTLDNTKHEFTVGVGETATLTVENSKTPVPEVFSGDHYAYIIGRDDGLVHPEAQITRAEVATIFFRLLSDEVRNANMTKSNSFADVKSSDWFNTAVSTMANMGIVNGYNGYYRPNDPITRAEFAAIAARFDKYGNASEASFTDIYEHWAMKEINIAANNGWILGYDDGTFRPDQNITRAEAMTIIDRVLQRIPESVDDLLPDMVIWPDNMDTTKWYYLMVQEATNSHYYERKANGYEYWTDLRPVRDWAALEK